MFKSGILASIILSSMLVAQTGGARPAGSDNGTRATILDGYSYLRNANNGFSGWEGQGTFNLNRYLAVKADVRTQFTATDALTTGLSSSLGNRQNTFRYSTVLCFDFDETLSDR
jgi:hypothetical protein